MGLIPEQSFTVREPAWWDDKAEYVLAEYPGREKAMELAGHNWDVIERSIGVLGEERTLENPGGYAEGVYAGSRAPVALQCGAARRLQLTDEFVAHIRSDNGFLLHVHKDSFERISNSVAYEVAELVLEQGFLYETAGSMDGGRQNYLTLLLNEPIYITGDTSAALPFAGLSWCHDGSGSLRLRSGTIRQVCQNTVAASEAEGTRLGTNFTFRHTKNWRERVEDAKKAIHGLREDVNVYVEVMEELAAIEVSPEQRDLFVSEIIGDANGRVSLAGPSVSQRVKNNVEKERTKILSLFGGPTVPEAIALTGYGLFQAGGEYFDHLRNHRSKDSYVKRTLLTDNPAKANLARTIREIVAA
jgi:phage/plasmid-like protein (TIGR03299 family)